MRTKAAVTYGLHQPFVVKEVELDEPKDNEVLVHLARLGHLPLGLALRGR